MTPPNPAEESPINNGYPQLPPADDTHPILDEPWASGQRKRYLATLDRSRFAA